jgi:hypothetical protein
MSRRALTLEQRRDYAISKAREHRRVELAPLREQVDERSPVSVGDGRVGSSSR